MRLINSYNSESAKIVEMVSLRVCIASAMEADPKGQLLFFGEGKVP